MNEIKDRLEKALPNIALRLQNELVLASPVDTGRLRNSIKVKETPNGILISMVEYGKLVEFGTPPHTIRAQTGKALRFEINKKQRLSGKGKGKFVFAKEVKHPGTRPNPFIRNTLQTKLVKIILEELAKQ